jgi:hypothetical protein
MSKKSIPLAHLVEPRLLRALMFERPGSDVRLSAHYIRALKDRRISLAMLEDFALEGSLLERSPLGSLDL